MAIVAAHKVLFVSNHVYWAGGRKASVHFLADEFVRRGYQVLFLTVGASLLTKLKNKGRYQTLNEAPKGEWRSHGNGIKSYVFYSLLSPANLKIWLLNRLTDWLISGFGKHLPQDVLTRIGSCDVVVIDSGSAVCFYELLRETNPKAKYIYNCADLLQSVGVRDTVIRIEQSMMRRIDVVRVPAPLMSSRLGENVCAVFAPHGVEKDLFDRCATNPYPPGSVNFVSVGNMQFDQAAIEHIAAADGNITIYLFGTRWRGTLPQNVIDYGERPFGETIPYIKFAGAGIAPYKCGPGHDYLVQSSLKVLQYTYCRLPILAPNTVDWRRSNIITYDPDKPSTFAPAVAIARAFPCHTIDRSEIASWAQTLDIVLDRLRAPAPAEQ